MDYYNTIDELVAATQEVIKTVEAEFGNLSAEQLNQKPEPGKWSIAQCLQHLIVSNETYYPQFDEIIAGKHKNSFYQNLTGIASFFGKNMVRDLGPEKYKSYKNPKLFTPSYSYISSEIVQQFTDHQLKMVDYYNQLKAVDTNKVVIYSPVSKMIIYSLHDALNILVRHAQRHLLQAQDAKKVILSH
jgi:hypothetical protein